MKDPNFITRQILDFRLKKTNDPIEETCLVQQFFSAERFYVVADTATTKEDWEARKFGIHTEHRAIHLFLERADAHQKAISIQSVLPDNSSMVFPITSEVALSLISDYAHNDIISAVWLCGKSPVTAKVGLSSLLRNFRNQSSSTIMSDSLYRELPSLDVGESTHLKSHSEKKEFNLISEVRQVLNLSSAEERRKLDPSDSYIIIREVLQMASTQGDMVCPKCGMKMVYDYYYKTGEEFNTCLCCGVKQTRILQRDEQKKIKLDENGKWVYNYTETPGYGTAHIVRKNGFIELYCFEQPLSEESKTAILEDIQNNADTSQSYLVTYSPETGIVTQIFGKAPSIDDDF